MNNRTCWLLVQIAIWVPFVVAFALGAPWWIAYAGALLSVFIPPLVMRCLTAKHALPLLRRAKLLSSSPGRDDKRAGSSQEETGPSSNRAGGGAELCVDNDCVLELAAARQRLTRLV